MHGGSVTASSAGVGQGSEFVVRLPVAHRAGRAPDADGTRRRDARPAEPAEARPRRVLVVDDNVDGARLLARLLRGGGHQVEVAHDGPAALERRPRPTPRRRPPRHRAARHGRLSRSPNGSASIEGMDRTLIVALTGYGQEADRRRSLEAGIDLHMVKPVNPATTSPPCSAAVARPRVNVRPSRDGCRSRSRRKRPSRTFPPRRSYPMWGIEEG